MPALRTISQHSISAEPFAFLPIYLGMVAIFIVGRHVGRPAGLFDGPIPSWAYVVGLQNFWMAAHQTFGADWLGATWSLAIEEQFYLLFPLAVYFLSTRALLRILIVLLALCPIGRIIASSFGDQLGYYVLMPLRADILAAGALVALAEHLKVTTLVRRPVYILFCLAACFFPVFAWVVEPSAFNMALWGQTYLVALFGSALFLVLDNQGSPALAPLRSRAASFVARISYALYLVHGPILVLMFAGARSAPSYSVRGSALLIAGAFLASIVVSWTSYVLIEGPLIKMAHRRFRYSIGPSRSIAELSGDLARPS